MSFIKKNSANTACSKLGEFAGRCKHRDGCGQHSEGTPLHQTCCNNGRLKVCAVNGDRATCARMASMGVLPGSELELLCKGGGQQCMVKVNGGTISLDMLTAATILVAPL